MTKAQDEMLALADKIEYAIKTEGEITLFETNGTRVVYVLRSLAALSVPPGDQAPQTLGGMIAAIYGELDAEDCNKIDRAWIEWRGRGTITYALASEVKKPRCDGADDLEHLDGMLDDRERGQ